MNQSPNGMEIFDRRQRRRQHVRVASPDHLGDGALKDLLVDDLLERLAGVNRPFSRVLDLGCHDGRLGKRITADWVVTADATASWFKGPKLAVVCEEDYLPFAEASFDLIVSAGSLHWVNDLPGALLQIRRLLKPDGLFLANFPGGESLLELRRAFLEAEAALCGGAALHVSPMIDVREAGALLQRAGFSMPVADADHLTLSYPSPLHLMQELRSLGETNAVASRSRKFLRRSVLTQAMERYQAHFSLPDGRIKASLDIISLTGWAPSPDQPKPLRPGSAKVRLADALRVSSSEVESPNG